MFVPLPVLDLNIAGEHFEAAASGNGPVDAAITALKRLLTATWFERIYYSGYQ